MTRIEARGLGKRFYRNWVFKGMDLQVDAGEKVLLCGDNGSGKSTLIRVLAGQLSATEGGLRLHVDGKEVDAEYYYRHISWSGPYMELYTDLNLKEAVQMHASFRPMMASVAEVMKLLQLEDQAGKLLKHFSSGMLHRVKVGLAILTRSRFLFLDEATTNMDEKNSRLVLELMNRYLDGRGLIYASNRAEEFGMFERRVVMGKA
jgi:ABC-type multidrug transport system ATPase subunit